MGSANYEQIHQGRILSLRLTENPQEAFWKLPPVSNRATVALLGWVMQDRTIDAGIPLTAARILSRTLCHSYNVTFLGPIASAQGQTEWQPVTAGWVRVLESPRKWFGKLRSFPLICTSDPETALQAFYVEQFNWALQNQVLLLSRLNGPPSLSYECVAKLLDRKPIDFPQPVDDATPRGAVVAGVDGDFAGMIYLDRAAYENTRKMLAKESSALGISLQIVSEAEFTNTSWCDNART